MVTLEEVLREHAPMLGRIVASYEANEAIQEELLQEVSLAIWQALPRYQGGSLKAYVARIAQNRCISHVGRAVREPRPEPLDWRQASAAESLEERLSVEERRRRLVAAIRSLPLPLRQTVILALEGFTHREIAESLGITENNAMVRFSRAKAALKEALTAEALT